MIDAITRTSDRGIAYTVQDADGMKQSKNKYETKNEEYQLDYQLQQILVKDDQAKIIII